MVRVHVLPTREVSIPKKEPTREEYLNSLLNNITVNLPYAADILDLAEYNKTRWNKVNPEITDVCRITCGHDDVHRCFLRDDSSEGIDDIRYSDGLDISDKDVVKQGKYNYNRNARDCFYIRPVLSFEKCPELWDEVIYPQAKANLNGIETRYSKVKFGYFIRNILNESCQNALNNKFKEGVLNFTNKFYTTDKTDRLQLATPFKPLNHYVYEYLTSRYVRMKLYQLKGSSFLNPASIRLSEGIYRKNEYVWVSVDEMPWIVDLEKKKLIAAEGIMSGIQYDNYDKRFDKIVYAKSNIKKYLNTYFKPQLLQYVKIDTKKLETIAQKEETRKVEEEKIKKEEEKQKPKEDSEQKKEIIKLLEEIRDYKKYYLGNDDINEKVKKLYDDYNKTISEIKENRDKNDKSLHIETKDPNFYYQRLVLNLNDIIEKLKLDSEKVKNCHEMIDILNECLKSNIDVNKDDICKSVKEANDTILNTNIERSIKNDLVRRLDDIINKNIERINSHINDFKNNPNAKSWTIEELKEEFRKDYQEFREQIEKVKDCRDMIDILNECKNDKIDISKDDICITVNKIKSVIFKFLADEPILVDLKKELEEILDNNINRFSLYIKEAFEGKSDINSKKLEDLKEEFAGDLRPYLMKIHELVSKKDDVTKILNETKQMINNTYKESQVAIAKNYMDELNKIISKIVEKGDQKTIDLLESKLEKDYDITGSYEKIIEKIGNNIQIAHKIQLDLDKDIKEIEEIEELEIDDIDINSYLNDQNSK